MSFIQDEDDPRAVGAVLAVLVIVVGLLLIL